MIIRVQPAVERFKMEYSGSWLVLSEQLKVLRVEPAEPDNLVQLDALLPEGAATTPGSFLTLDAPSEPTAWQRPCQAAPQRRKMQTKPIRHRRPPTRC